MKLKQFVVRKLRSFLSLPAIIQQPANPFFIKDETAVIVDCKFGKYNKVGKNSYLYKASFGDFTYCSQNTTIMNASIGKYCSLAQGVSIGLGKHPLKDFVSTHPAFYSIHKQCGYTYSKEQHYNEMGFVTIGNDVWIGVNAVVLDDIVIGNGAVIAANAVVNQDVPPYAIVAGIPAKIIKYRFESEEIDFLQGFEWWNKDLSWLEDHYTDMHDIKNFKIKYANS